MSKKENGSISSRNKSSTRNLILMVSILTAIIVFNAFVLLGFPDSKSGLEVSQADVVEQPTLEPKSIFDRLGRSYQVLKGAEFEKLDEELKQLTGHLFSLNESLSIVEHEISQLKSAPSPKAKLEELKIREAKVEQIFEQLQGIGDPKFLLTIGKLRRDLENLSEKYNAKKLPPSKRLFLNDFNGFKAVFLNDLAHREAANAELEATVEEDVEVLSGIKKETESMLLDRLAKARGSLVVNTIPKGATISISNRKARSPAIIRDIPAETELDLTVSLRGYKEYSEKIILKNDKKLDLPTIKLERKLVNFGIDSAPDQVSYELIPEDKSIEPRKGVTPHLEEELPVGDYTIALRYRDWPITKKSISLERNNQTFHHEFVSGNIRVSTQPEGASVLVDGKVKGETPLLLEDLHPGKISVKLEKEGFVQKLLTVLVEPNGTTLLETDLEERVALATLEISTIPSGVKVRVADREAFTPTVLNDLPAEEELVITGNIDGYEQYSQSLVLKDREHRKLRNVQLERSKGSLSINTSPIGVRYKLISMGSNRLTREGKTPILERNLPTGSYTLTLSHKSWPIIQKEVIIRKGEQSVYEAFTPSVLHVTSYPSGATVLLNGVEKGTTPITVENISPGEQQLSLKKLGYQTINESIVLNTGQTSDIQFELLETNIPKLGHDFDILTRSSVVRMIFVNPGSFQMGSTKGSPGERPVHEVVLSEGYWLGETEVTQIQWADIMGLNPSEFPNENQPVENVSWEDAMEFCEKVNSIERKRGFLPAGYKFTLPTEAQWEFACRSGSRAIETTSIESLAWYRENTNGKPSPVAQREHNKWGFYDMHGNIWEWCLDKYDSEYYSVSPSKDPQGSKYGSSRVIRGGGWNYDIWHCRSTVRRGISPGNRMNYIGFRLALVPILE